MSSHPACVLCKLQWLEQTLCSWSFTSGMECHAPLHTSSNLNCVALKFRETWPIGLYLFIAEWVTASWLRSGITMHQVKAPCCIKAISVRLLSWHVQSAKADAFSVNSHFAMQDFPDAIQIPAFPSMVLRPGQTYTNIAIWRFSNATVCSSYCDEPQSHVCTTLKDHVKQRPPMSV